MLGISGSDAQNSMFLKIKLWGGDSCAQKVEVCYSGESLLTLVMN